MMLIDRLKLLAITVVALMVAAGLGASIVAQQVADETGRSPVVSGAQAEPDARTGNQQVLQANALTDFDPDTLMVVRSLFDSLIEKVFVHPGDAVKTGDPLLQLHSTDLAKARIDFELARLEHEQSMKLLDQRARWAEVHKLPVTGLIGHESAEAKSRLAMKIAKDKLLVFGLTEEEINDSTKGDLAQKAKMILRARSDGVVIKRSVVQGIYYNAKDELMRIAALDHLWVRGGVRSQDADKVKVGQKLKVVFPNLGQTVDARVEYISRATEPETQMAKFRTSIPNPEGRFKAGILVRVLLEVPSTPAQTTESHTVHIKAPGSNIHERLENLRSKLDLLLKARAEHSATFEGHLAALEQELELLVKEAAAK